MQTLHTGCIALFKVADTAGLANTYKAELGVLRLRSRTLGYVLGLCEPEKAAADQSPLALPGVSEVALNTPVKHREDKPPQGPPADAQKEQEEQEKLQSVKADIEKQQAEKEKRNTSLKDAQDFEAKHPDDPEAKQMTQAQLDRMSELDVEIVALEKKLSEMSGGAGPTASPDSKASQTLGASPAAQSLALQTPAPSASSLDKLSLSKRKVKLLKRYLASFSDGRTVPPTRHYQNLITLGQHGEHGSLFGERAHPSIWIHVPL